MLNRGLHFTEILGMRDSPASNFAPWCIHTITYEAIRNTSAISRNNLGGNMGRK